MHPDGRMEVFIYSNGTYHPPAAEDAPGTYSIGTGSDLIATTVHGTLDHPQGLANQSTREVTVSSSLGRTLLQTVEVFTGSTWSCCGKASDTDAEGRTTFYAYDDLNRVTSTTQQGVSGGTFAAQSDIKTVYTYDGLGRTTQTLILAGDLSQTTHSGYDSAGRLLTSTDAAGLKTTYYYSTDNLASTVTAAGGATQTTTRHRDGRTQSVTGTAAPPQYYAYGVNTDGSQWSEVRTGAADSPMVQRTVIDMLGRTIRIEKPGPQGLEVTENFYDDHSRLIRTTQPGQADTLYTYDALGNPIRTGLDIDANGQLDPGSTDRISESDTAYSQLGAQWWQQTTQRVYPNANDPTAVIAAIQRTQISGLLEDGERSESVSIDIHGNATVNRTVIDRASKTRTQTDDAPDSSIDARTVSVNGRVVESRSKTGIVTTIAYDSLGRQTGVTDARTGTSLTHYDDKGRVDYVQDAAGQRTTFAYDPATGRKILQTDALDKTTRLAYNPQGQTTRTWGHAPYPVKYDYDPYGRMIAMATYRAVNGNEKCTTFGKIKMYHPARFLTTRPDQVRNS